MGKMDKKYIQQNSWNTKKNISWGNMKIKKMEQSLATIRMQKMLLKRFGNV